MADEQHRPSGDTPSVADLVAQLHGLTERLAGAAGSLATPALSAMPHMAPPLALTAAQLQAMSSTVAAQRRSVEALRTQLAAFDEQLEVLERILEPLTTWSRGLAGVEDRLLHPLGHPEDRQD